MRLRFDLVAKITPEMLMESVLANHHRYKAEPLLSKTGTGSLSPASTADRAIEEKLSTEITRKLMSASDNDGTSADRESPSGTDRRLISDAVVQSQAGFAALTWLGSRRPNFCILHSKPGGKLTTDRTDATDG